MVDRKTESSIKASKSFIELWVKFHSMYKEAIAKDNISRDDEEKFLETQAMMRAKYEELKRGLDLRYMPHSRYTDPVSDLLGVNTIRFMSEMSLKKVNDDWKDSYLFLNNILEHLKTRKRRLEQFNPAAVFFKSVFSRTRSEVW